MQNAEAANGRSVMTAVYHLFIVYHRDLHRYSFSAACVEQEEVKDLKKNQVISILQAILRLPGKT